MKVVAMRVMRGPNYWSVKHPKIIVLKVDLEAYSNVQTSEIPGFSDRLEALLPTMASHRAMEESGGFFQKVRRGTDLGKVIQHIALELQTLAGMDCGYGRTCKLGDEGIYSVIFSYQEEQAGKYTAAAAIRITEALCKNQPIDLATDIHKLHEFREWAHFGPSTQSIVDEAVSRGIPYITVPDTSIIQLGYGQNQKRIKGTITCSTGEFAVAMAGNKDKTKRILDNNGVPVPKGVIIYTEEELKEAVEELGYPLVTKPLDGHQGKGASINIGQWKDALSGFAEAQKYSRAVIVEKFISGFDYRLLVINGKFVAAAKRTPAAVTGNGRSTILELIEEVNKDPRRGVGHEKELTKIHLDKDTETILENQKLTLESVLPEGEILYLKTTANLSTGGTGGIL